jgi:hypothetical protein
MVALLACTNAVPGMAADKNDIRGVIKTVESGGVVALCAPDAVVVDDFGQHLWKGPSACSNWMMALGVYMSAHNMTAPSLKFGEPWQITVDQRAAYVVVPATFGFKVKGKDGTLDGIWTWSLKKTDAGWKINAMAWTARACADVPSCQAAWAPGS